MAVPAFTPFDFVLIALALVSAITGFASGMLRSLASLIAYVAATLVALYATPFVAPYLANVLPAGWMREVGAFVGVFLVSALVLGLVMQSFVSLVFGTKVSFGDRVAGLALGAVRALLVAVLLVVIFDRMLPREQEPTWLQGSILRPHLSTLGQHGLRSLPADLTRQIDRIRRGGWD